jgi:hypothetical protein
LFARYASYDQAINVYILTDGSVTEDFPAATYTADGAVVLRGDERVAHGFVGGGSQVVTDAEAAILTAAGYAENLS